QHSCAKSSGELLLRFQPGKVSDDEATVFTGIEHRLQVERRRFMQESTDVVSLRSPRRVRMPLTGRAKPPGQVRDDRASRNLCLPLCKGVSGTGIASPPAEAAEHAMRGYGR